MSLNECYRKIASAQMILPLLTSDLARVVCPSTRAYIASQIALRQTQIERLLYKINTYNVPQAWAAPPLPEKKTPAPKVTAVVTKKKSVDKRARSKLK